MRLVRHMFAGFVCYPAWRAGLAISSLYCACMVAVSISAVTASADAPRIAAVLDAFDVADLTAKIATVCLLPQLKCKKRSETRSCSVLVRLDGLQQDMSIAYDCQAALHSLYCATRCGYVTLNRIRRSIAAPAT